MNKEIFQRFLTSTGLFLPLMAVVLLSLFNSVLHWLPLTGGQTGIVSILLFGGILLALWRLVLAIRLNIATELESIDQWSEHVTMGRLGDRMPIPEKGTFRSIVIQLNTMCGELARLTYYMDAQVNKHTFRLAQKTASLKTLYEVARVINHSNNLDELLSEFLVILKGMVNAQAAMVRICDGGGKMHVVGKIGFENTTVACETGVINDQCACAKALDNGDVQCESNPKHCDQLEQYQSIDGRPYEVITIPLKYMGKTLGVYNLFVRKTGLSDREDTIDLLTSVGNHLGMAIEKDRLDKESRRFSILQERTLLSHELHDSLAQTLVSLRFQVQVLQDMLSEEGHEEALDESHRIKNGLDEANTELRELIAHFRAPLGKRGLIPAIESLVARFKQETQINCLFQNESQATDWSVDMEMQVVRIVQECLANIRKHSQAQTVRVLLKNNQRGQHIVLVEDDGVGIQTQKIEGHPGEHVGLSIMEERARRLPNGELKIESEPGEGTRVELIFQQGAA